MLKRFVISYSVMFALANLVADLTELIAPGNEWGPDDTKSAFYSSAVAFALMVTFLWQDKKKKTLSRNEGTPEQTSSGLQ